MRCVPTIELARTSSRSSASPGGSSRPSTGAPTTGMPASAAIAATVVGASPEMTRISTFSSSRNAIVSRVSGRSSSASTTSPSGVSPAGGGASGEARVRGTSPAASASTRRPAAASAATRAPSVSSRAKCSGAPRTWVRPAIRTPLQRRREAKGTFSSIGSGVPGTKAATASRVPLRLGELAAKRPRTVENSPSSTPVAATSSTTRRVSSVSVPVLSRQMTSTEASDSTAFSCWLRAPRRAMRRVATAKVTATSSTRPSGMIVTTPATAVETDSRKGVSFSISDQPRRIPRGTIATPRIRISRSSASSSGERGWRNSRAWPTRRSA